jgi:hypothetical protein
MSANPLKDYFRQPKIFLKLPSLGRFNDSTTITGNVESLPIYGMNGMDKILIKTPDALLNGESTVRIIQSCCPNILNAWEMTTLDIESLLVAIRIATSGSIMDISEYCPNCSTENTYELNVNKFLEHYNTCNFISDVMIGDLIVKLKPLTYKKSTEFGLENFALQKQINHISQLEDDKEKNTLATDVFVRFGVLQNKILLASIDYIETPNGIVSEFGFIKEWIDNCDGSDISKIKESMDINSKEWRLPSNTVNCSSCGFQHDIEVDLDQASFFDIA